MREKKITIKPFLNIQLGASGTLTEGNRIFKTYPLYYKVTFNRKNTQLRSLYAHAGYNDIGSIESGIIDFESKVLNKIIAYETTEKQDDYQLTGLKRKFELYALSIDYVLDTYLRKQLQGAINGTGHPYQFVLTFDNYNINNSIFNIYDACRSLFPNINTYLDTSLLDGMSCFKAYREIIGTPMFRYDFHTLIDWIDGSAKEFLQEGLIKFYETENVLSMLNTIDKIIKFRLNS